MRPTLTSRLSEVGELHWSATAAVPARHTRVVVLVDVDGVLSPIHPTSNTWGDETAAGHFCGPVLMSPTLAGRLEQLHALDQVECCWLTSWTTAMREEMPGFPGRLPGSEWSAVVDAHLPAEAGEDEDGWWKLDALVWWLGQNPDVTAIAWLDDHLAPHPDGDDLFREERIELVRQVLADAGVTDVHLVSPRKDVGLTPQDVDQLERWVADRLPAAKGPAVEAAEVDGNCGETVVPATGNGMKSHGSYDAFLTVSGGEGNHDDGPEVHLRFESNDGEQFAQGWFRVDDLEAAIQKASTASTAVS